MKNNLILGSHKCDHRPIEMHYLIPSAIFSNLCKDKHMSFNYWVIGAYYWLTFPDTCLEFNIKERGKDTVN